MGKREIIDAVIPTPKSFARAIGASTSSASMQILKASIRENFPPPPPAPTLSSTKALHTITSLPELQLAILKARAERRRVRPSTKGLTNVSNCDFLASGGHLLDLSPLNKMVYVSPRRVVIVQAGATLEQLDTFLRDHGLTLPVNFARKSNSQTVGAAFVTGEMNAAGTGEGLLGDIAIEVSIVDAFGRLRVFSRQSHPELFTALRLSLGLFGVVYDVALRVTHSPSVVTVVHSFARLGALLSGRGTSFRHVAAKHRAAQLIWYPFNEFSPDIPWTPQMDHVWLHAFDHTSEKRTIDKSAPPLLRILTLPQWLTVHSQRLIDAGYECFKSAHAPYFVADAFQQTAWMLSSQRRLCHISDAVNYRYSDEISAITSVSIAVPVKIRRCVSVNSSHDSPSAVTSLNSEKRTHVSDRCDDETISDEEMGSQSSDIDEEIDNYNCKDGDDGYATLALCRKATDADGWAGVHAAVEAAASRIHRMASIAPNAVATTRVYVNILGRSDAMLSPTNVEHCADAAAIITLEGAVRIPQWDALASDVLQFWAAIPNARWVWSRHSAPLLRPNIAVALRIPGETLKKFVRLRDDALVDDYGMFVDDALDAVVDGAFSQSFSLPSQDCSTSMNTSPVSIGEENSNRIQSLSIINQPLKSRLSVQSAWRRWKDLDKLPFEYKNEKVNINTDKDGKVGLDNPQILSTQRKETSLMHEHSSESDTSNENTSIEGIFHKGPTKNCLTFLTDNSWDPMKVRERNENAEVTPQSIQASFPKLKQMSLEDGYITVSRHDERGHDEDKIVLGEIFERVWKYVQTYIGLYCIALLFLFGRTLLQKIGILIIKW